MADLLPNQPPPGLATMYTTHTSSAGIVGQILYPITEVDSYRAAEYAAGSVPTLEIGDGETWPPEEPG